MANAAQIVAAFRDVAATKSLTEEEMTDLVKDGMLAGLARIYGAPVRAEIEIDDTTWSDICKEARILGLDTDRWNY